MRFFMVVYLEKFIWWYSLQDIKKLEHKDPQFLALQNCRKKVCSSHKKNENLFLFLVVQCAIVSYQIAWTGETWWTEAWSKFLDDWDYLLNLWNNNEQNGDWRLDFLKTSKNNKRIYNIKKSRIDKLNQNTEKITWSEYWNQLLKLNELLAKTLNCKLSSKTIVFAIKMYGYAYTIISWHDVSYPMKINIPIDSRLKKIYNTCMNLDISTENEVMNYFGNLSQKYCIPPLDLDTLLWLEYRKILKK